MNSFAAFWLHVRGQMAQEGPCSPSGFWMLQVLCSLAGLQEWDCESLHTCLFWGLTVALQLDLPPLRVTVVRSCCLVSLCCDGVSVLSLG